MRAARLISLVLLLQRRGMTGAELAAELEVSERTVARDVLALSEAGVPVYAERGRTGGYRLLDGYRTRLTGLHRAEAEALLLAGIPGPAAELGLGAEVGSARRKLSAALAPGLQDVPERVAHRFHLDAPGWFHRPEAPSALPVLAAAVWQDQRVRATYRRRDGQVQRELDPHGLVLKAGSWYLAARVGPQRRVYKVDRFGAVQPVGTFRRDESFDLAEFWRRHGLEFAGDLLRAEITVRLTPAGARKVPVHLSPAAADRLATGAVDERGRITATLPVESLDVAADQLLAFGPDAEVLDPPELRERLVRTLREWAGCYAGHR